MVDAATDNHRHHPTGWLDGLAVSMAVICAVHCLLTPILLVALPILATTLWVDSSFHWWMLLLVIPTTVLSIGMGCRRHKDSGTVFAASMGLGLLVIAAYVGHGFGADAAHAHAVGVAHAHSPFAANSILSVVGGLAVIVAHVRNFLLCRRSACRHD
jgi:hypothetical protein